MSVTVRRSGAIGDVLLATALLPALKGTYGRVLFATSPRCAEIFAGNPFIDAVTVPTIAEGDLIDLDDAYESKPFSHIVEAYAQRAGISISETQRPSMEFDRSPAKLIDVLIHPTISWPSRTLPEYFWQVVANHFLNVGKRVGYVRAANEPPPPSGVLDFCGKSFHDIATLIDSARVFICADSLPLHIASVTDTPIVGLFTVAMSKYRAPWLRNPELFTGIDTVLDCGGCLHRQLPPVRFTECKREEKNLCVKSFDVQNVIEAAERYL